MKKSCNVLMIVAIIFSIMIMILCFVPLEFLGSSYTQEAVNKIEEMNGAPGSGEALALIMPFALLSDFGRVLYLTIFNVLIPGTTLSGVLILQIGARLFQIGKEKKWKNIVSLILTVISVLVVSSLLFTLVLCIGVLKFVSLFLTLILCIIYIIEIIKMTKKLDVANKEIIVKE